MSELNNVVKYALNEFGRVMVGDKLVFDMKLVEFLYKKDDLEPVDRYALRKLFSLNCIKPLDRLTYVIENSENIKLIYDLLNKYNITKLPNEFKSKFSDIPESFKTIGGNNYSTKGFKSKFSDIPESFKTIGGNNYSTKGFKTITGTGTVDALTKEVAHDCTVVNYSVPDESQLKGSAIPVSERALCNYINYGSFDQLIGQYRGLALTYIRKLNNEISSDETKGKKLTELFNTHKIGGNNLLRFNSFGTQEEMTLSTADDKFILKVYKDGRVDCTTK